MQQPRIVKEALKKNVAFFSLPHILSMISVSVSEILGDS